MSGDGGRSVGTLGGAGTFAGQATQVAMQRYPELRDVSYFPTMDDVWAAIADGRIDVGILTAETTRTGFTETARQLVGRSPEVYVLGEVVVPYRCMLLGKPGSSLDRIELVLGHGSIRQCEAFLRSKLPAARIQVHALNSLAAAEEVLSGDGTAAVVGTEQSGRQSGLVVLAADIDQGSEGTWWLMSRELAVGRRVDRVVLGVDAVDADVLRRVLVRMEAFGFLLRSMGTVGLGRLFHNGHLLVLTAAEPSAVPVAEVLGDMAGCWVLGAFSSTEDRLPAVRADQMGDKLH